MNFNYADFLKGLEAITTSRWFPAILTLAIISFGYFIVNWIESREVQI
jgi:hypothetical protein